VRRAPTQQIEFSERVHCEGDWLCETRHARVVLVFRPDSRTPFAGIPSIRTKDSLGFPEVLMAYSRLFAAAAKRIQDTTPFADYQI
jgi:hypothetical protein